MVDVIMQAVGNGIEAVESGIGGCVLGTAATAAAVCVGFRLAGYKLALTCRTVGPIRRRKGTESPYDAKSDAEKNAEAGYAMTHSRWTAASLRKQQMEKEIEADQMELETERLKEKRRAFQEQRVAELDAIREARKAVKEAAEQAEKPDGGSEKK